jgi:competence protein ComEC
MSVLIYVIRIVRQTNLAALVFTAVMLWSNSALAQEVIPSDRVTSLVNVRQGPFTQSAIVGELRPGEKGELLQELSGWYRIRLDDGTVGFVSKAWTEIASATRVAFEVHFLDVGTGDSAIIDIGTNEIVIDGGDSPSVPLDYARRHNLIDGPIELVIVTHGDSDHWKGLNRLLGFEPAPHDPYSVREFWEPGYDRDCGPLQSYKDFVSDVEHVPGMVFRRPLEEFFDSAVATSQVDTITMPGVANLKVMLLHTDSTPESDNGDCPYLINNASIVLLIKISGVRFLFTGDANGKERNEPSPGTPGHIEAKLLALEDTFPGILEADVLKVPHHGSETASTQDFINTVDPAFAIISASTKHDLPRETVVKRYRKPGRVVLRTDRDRKSNNDHIVCVQVGSSVNCDYRVH